LITCKHMKNRCVSASYNEKECFESIDSNYFFICLIVEGSIVLMIDGERCYLGQNMLVCFAPGRIVKPLASYHLKAYSVSFSPAFINVNLTRGFICSSEYRDLSKKEIYPDLSLFFNHNDIFKGILPLDSVSSQTAFRFIQQMMHQFRNQPDRIWSCRARASLFSFIETFRPLYQQLLKREGLSDDFIENLIAFIHRELTGIITIQSLCTQFHTNRNALNQRFRRATGLSVIDYVIQRRISLAKYFLAFTELSIQEIAESCGFKEQTYFTKVFKKREGIVPSLYREKARRSRPYKTIDNS